MKKKCDHCGSELIEHEGGLKDGALHCNECGCCFELDGKTIRDGHPACRATDHVVADEPKPKRTKKVTRGTDD